jgi:hypothetical protein
LLASAILGTLAAHFVEVQVGIPTITTQLLFWTLVALLFSLSPSALSATLAASTPVRKKEAKKQPPPSSIQQSLVPGLITVLVCTTLVADFAISRQRVAEQGALIITLMLFAALGSAALLARTWADYWRTLLIASSTLLVLAIYNAALGALAHPAATTAVEALRIDSTYQWFFGTYNLIVWASAAAISLAFSQGERTPAQRSTASNGVFTALGFILAAGLGWQADVGAAQAEMTSKHAQTLEANNRLEPALGLFTELTQLHPAEPDYWYRVGQLQRRIAQQNDMPAERSPHRIAAETALRSAIQARPFGADAAVTLARLYHDWATDEPAKADQAEAAFASATWVTPANLYLWNDWARFEYAIRGNFNAAQAKLAQSLALDPTFDSTHLSIGDMHLAHAAIDPSASGKHLANAAAAYRNALKLQNKPQDLAKTHIKLGKVAQAKAPLSKDAFEEAHNEFALAATLQSGSDLAGTNILQGNLFVQASNLQPEQSAQHATTAIAYFERGLAEQAASGQAAREFTPWMVQRTLAQLYFGLGNKPAALAAAQLAQAGAPQSEQAYFAGMINELAPAK